MKIFTSEAEFEEALIQALKEKGWEDKVIKYPTEEDLLQNWADILFENNRGIDRLNDYPLTEGEMQQILEQINQLRTPLKLNGFINGRSVSIKRDNPDDKLHFGKEVSLKIYDRHEISAGQSRYQIVQQPKFKSASKMLGNRRGDLMLLINGMPLFHIELKRSGVSVSQAYHQIEKYSKEGIFSGIFSLVQIFVAMEPEETVYFTNPGTGGKFNKDYYFNWADFNNEPINNWKDIASTLLHIPMAHQLIGFYTIADKSDGVLKVMRSYQYYAAHAISDKVARADWTRKNNLGGYIEHTTGSGKTMTSFKSAQLIAQSKDADKVLFLMDRIELGNQSLEQYQNFAEEQEEVQATENTNILITKLKSDKPKNTLIVTSIQKMSLIKDGEFGMNEEDIRLINKKRIVIIIDEAHRSTFGDMLITIKETFPYAMFFGFTGTPIYKENQKKSSTTATIFGDGLHRYSIADGIRDKNVLGFDVYQVLTYRNKDLREAVALTQSKSATVEEALEDPKKKKVFLKFMNDLKMGSYIDDKGKYIKGIEDYLPKAQYSNPTHFNEVVKDITSNFTVLSQAGKFHALFATHSIPEAIEYYNLFKENHPELKVTALFDPNIDNSDGGYWKQESLIEILEDYNKNYEMEFTLSSHSKFKEDIALRLAHKEPYLRIERNKEQQIDILIVVDQMLTGYDSKWINTLYMDKILRNEHIIQAFSRTNRLFGPDKPFGTIRYYRKPNTMKNWVESAVKLYSGDKPFGLFVDELDVHLNLMNNTFEIIKSIFENAGIKNFEKVPDEPSEIGKFAKEFIAFNAFLESARIQGFNWNKLVYEFGKGSGKKVIEMLLDENTYLILALRYKELFPSGTNKGEQELGVPYELEGHLTEIDTTRIDTDYMNSRFDKFIKDLGNPNISKQELEATLSELFKTFSTLTQEEQKYANIFIRDVRSGNAELEAGKSFRTYITEYAFRIKSDQVHKLASLLGLEESRLRDIMSSNVTEQSLNEYGRFDKLKESVDIDKAKQYFEKKEGKPLPLFRVIKAIHTLLKRFILEGGFELE